MYYLVKANLNFKQRLGDGLSIYENYIAVAIFLIVGIAFPAITQSIVGTASKLVYIVYRINIYLCNGSYPAGHRI